LLRNLAAVGAFAATAHADRARRVDSQLGKRLPPPGEWQVKIGDKTQTVSISEEAIIVDGAVVELTAEYTPGDSLITASIDEEPLSVKITKTVGGFTLNSRGATHQLRILPMHIAHHTEHMIEKIPPDLSKYLLCPMPGLLVALHVKEGDVVEEGQPLAVVEAMKMENILRAEKNGVVKSIAAEQGDSLAVDAVILELE
jgi:propionyl-CoA carboxylase alpha chain